MNPIGLRSVKGPARGQSSSAAALECSGDVTAPPSSGSRVDPIQSDSLESSSSRTAAYCGSSATSLSSYGSAIRSYSSILGCEPMLPLVDVFGVQRRFQDWLGSMNSGAELK